MHTTPGLGTDAVGVQARIAGFLVQEQCNHSMIYREREENYRKEGINKKEENGGEMREL